VIDDTIAVVPAAHEAVRAGVSRGFSIALTNWGLPEDHFNGTVWVILVGFGRQLHSAFC
jgi:hypothetical protein